MTTSAGRRATAAAGARALPKNASGSSPGSPRRCEGSTPDVVGLVEVENGPPDALRNLVAALDRGAGGDRYAFVATGPIGTDVIRVALLYRPGRVAAVGPFAVLDRRASPDFDDTRNRPALAQAIEERATGERFSVVVNHFKSKSGSCDGDPDTGDGQAACNLTRTRAARALAGWLDGDPTRSGDPDVLILGDLNAYAREDPPRALAAAGYTDLLGRFRGEAAYTFAFRGRFGVLDYAFASPEMAAPGERCGCLGDQCRRVPAPRRASRTGRALPLFGPRSDPRRPRPRAIEEPTTGATRGNRPCADWSPLRSRSGPPGSP